MENRNNKYSDLIRIAIEILNKKEFVDSWDIALTEQLISKLTDKRNEQSGNRKS